ncbi:MAG TPA: molecular chaperone TorD family protein [Noviherbaspirillum sp.]|uniref:TorD/DmsD family molecular chaperone n=1 Tax=Noviherbaspirillum sp. TaxID=1926288 RepID=UPI002F92430B
MEQAILSRMGVPPPLAPEDQARADLYALIATLLLKPPDAALLTALAAADALPAADADHALDQAWEEMVLAAGLLPPDAVRDEFDALFISVGMPALNPYGSRYLTGFMMERPLASLRDDLRVLGLTRAAGVAEAEDHLGAVCEAMRVLIGGTHGASRQPLGTQRTFFTRHLAPWYARCLDDIREAQAACFYRHVARFARAFLDVEAAAFSIGNDADEAKQRTPAADE